MSELIISVSGLRGIVGENLTGEVACDYGCAFGGFLQEGGSGEGKLSVCIGRDSRVSGEELLSAVAEGLCSVGVDVIDLGIVTTPCVGIMLRELGCGGGVVITASHNPGEYNGIKLLLSNGIAPSPELAAGIRECFLGKRFEVVEGALRGEVSGCDRTDEVHIDKVLAIVDGAAIAAKRFKVVLDSVNGAGGRITKKLLEKFGCDVVAINDEPTGLFAHTPEPTKENLVGLCEDVKRFGGAVGFAQDPDADRLAIVDENGRCWKVNLSM